MNDWFEAEQHVERAHEFFEANRWDEAESELREAIALNPYRAEWHFNLGLTLEAADRRREAIEAFIHAHELDPAESQPMLLIGVNYLRTPDSTPKDAREGIRWLNLAAHADQAQPDAHVHLIEAHARVGDHEQAELEYYLALQWEHADQALACINIADSLTDQGDHSRAAIALRQAIQIDPTMLGVYARLAGAYAALGKRRRAQRFFLRELRTNPGDIDTLLDLGCLLVQMNRHDEAAEKFRRVIEIESDNPDAHYELGLLAMRDRRLDDALRSFRLVVRLDPKDHRALRKLAQTHVLFGRQEKAKELLCDQLLLLGQSPEQFSLADRTELGRQLLEVDLPVEAAGLLEQVIKEHPLDAALWRALSVALLRSGKRRAGLCAARREHRLAPKSISAMHNIVLALIEEGQLRRANVWLRAGLRVKPHDAGLRRLRRRLRTAQIRRFFQR
jgi:tetratricopeptide (TPR) repeat protein